MQKSKTMITIWVLSALVLASSLSLPVAASDFRNPTFTDPKPDRDGDGKPDRSDNGEHHHRKHYDDDDVIYRCTNCVVRIYTPPPNSIIVIQDQNIIRTWLRSNRRVVFCAAGVTISDTGCVPANYMRSYQIGYDAPPQLVLEQLPPELAMQLHPPPGYYYAQLGNDIVLVNIGTRRVADAVYLPVQ